MVSRRSIRFPLVNEGVKVTSCLVLAEAVKRRGLARHLNPLRVGEFEVAISGGIWVAIRADFVPISIFIFSRELRQHLSDGVLLLSLIDQLTSVDGCLYLLLPLSSIRQFFKGFRLWLEARTVEPHLVGHLATLQLAFSNLRHTITRNQWDFCGIVVQ